MVSSSSSNSGGVRGALLTGATAPNPQVVASFRFGDNSVQSRGPHEFAVAAGTPHRSRGRAQGHLIWDPSYRGRGSAFFSVAPVRLEVTLGEVQWSVGTNQFISCACKPYERIEKIQVVATAANGAPHRLVQWDSLEVTLHHADGRSETHVSSCLPRVSTAQPPRRSVRSKPTSSAGALQQFAEITPVGGCVTGMQLRGVVRLKAGDPGTGAAPLRADDLQGRVLVFTNRAGRRRTIAKG